MDDTLKFYNYTSVYRKDYLKRKFKKTEPFVAKQMFKDPVLEGFKNYLEIGKDQLREFEEDGDQYLEKVKSSKKKIGKMYFEEPLDSITIKENKLLDGKTVYQVDYCDVGMKETLHETKNLYLVNCEHKYYSLLQLKIY